MTLMNDAVLRDMWSTAASTRDISERLGCSQSYVSIRASQLGLPPRRARATDAEMRYLAAAARERGVSVARLGSMILRAVARDRLVDAVLDDAEETSRAA